MGMVQTAGFSTAGLPKSHAKEMADVVTSSVCDVHYKNDACFLSIESWKLDDLLINHVTSAAQTVQRTRSLIARSGIDHYRLRLCKTGGVITRAGGEDRRVADGDIILLDLGMEFETEVSGGEMTFVYIPRDLLIPLLPETVRQNLHCVHFRGETVIGKMLASQIDTLRTLLPEMSADDVPFVCRSTLDIVAASIVGLQGKNETVARRFPAVMATQIKNFILEHLSDPEIGPDLIMNRFRVSRTSLYEMFRSCSGVSNYIHMLRLRRCLRNLTDPTQQHRRIGEIAFSMGFNNESHFSRAFREAFDMTPRDARHGKSITASTQRTREKDRSSGPQQIAETLDEWKRALGQ